MHQSPELRMVTGVCWSDVKWEGKGEKKETLQFHALCPEVWPAARPRLSPNHTDRSSGRCFQWEHTNRDRHSRDFMGAEGSGGN